MNTTLTRAEPGALSDILADILGHLRGRYYGRFHDGPEEALHRQADGCVERLAGHFRYAQTTYFPELRMTGAEASRDIEELEKDHRILGLHARYLAIQIRDKNETKAYEAARSFLAVVLHHIRRETGAPDRCAHALEVTDAKRLRGLIDRCRTPAESKSRLEPGAESKPQKDSSDRVRGD
jgi:hypothetical protein